VKVEADTGVVQVVDTGEMVEVVIVVVVPQVVDIDETHHLVAVIVVTHELREVAVMMVHAEKMARDLLDHQDEMMEDMHHALHVAKVAMVVIADIVTEVDHVLIILMRVEAHMVHKSCKKYFLRYALGKFIQLPVFYATKNSHSKNKRYFSYC